MKHLLPILCSLLLASCASTNVETSGHAASDDKDQARKDILSSVLQAQPAETKARYQYRHPAETLEFFGIEPGMTIVDILPGEPGWYAPILKAYLGSKGKLIGADYSLEMWSLYGGFADATWLQERKKWPTDYVTAVSAIITDDGASAETFILGAVPANMHSSADAVMMIRALHPLNRFEENDKYFTKALADVHTVLKPGGVLGIIQHRAPEGNSDASANGRNGYLKQSHIISFVEAAGFELIAASEINANPKDIPGDNDIVWRLPPTFAGTDGRDEQRAQMQAIGESDRMTLKFRKVE